MLGAGYLLDWLFPSILLSLRIAPVFAFAPPFTLVPTPVVFRVLIGMGMAACLAVGAPAVAGLGDASFGKIAVIAFGELMIGLAIALALQLAFAALYVAGRTIDIQAGYGLALLIDPSTRGQTPLVGMLLAYCAGAVFFAMNGLGDLLGVIATSLRIVPLGSGVPPTSLAPLAGYLSAIFSLAFGVAGGVILCLFLVDMAIAMMSKTIPQMNVLVLGLQAKTLVTLMVLPVALGGAGALLARMMRLALDTIPRLL